MQNQENLENSARNISIFNLAWPIFVQMILSISLGYIDTIMISRCSETAVGAIGNANQIMGFLRLAFSIITSATGVIVAQYIGAKQTEKMNQIYTLSVLFNLVLSVAVCFIITTFSRPLLTAIQIPSIMMEDANSYMKIVGFFLFTDAIVMIFSQVFNCHGKTSVGMFIFFGMNVMNILGNYTFLFGPLSYLNLGVKGVAISTTLSSTLGMIVSYILFRKIIKGKISFKLLKPFPKELLVKLIKLGIPTAGENISYNIAQIIITAFVNTMGPEAINAKIFCNLLTLFSLIY
jgi:Na+-driven multidrug efflux pump